MFGTWISTRGCAVAAGDGRGARRDHLQRWRRLQVRPAALVLAVLRRVFLSGLDVMLIGRSLICPVLE
eukprot:3050182-Rhodomonas_salina.3